MHKMLCRKKLQLSGPFSLDTSIVQYIFRLIYILKYLFLLLGPKLDFIVIVIGMTALLKPEITDYTLWL